LDVIAGSQRWSAKTQLVYQNAVVRFLAFARGDLSGAAVERWRDHLLAVEELEAATVHKLVAAIKAVSRRHAALSGGFDFGRAAELPGLVPWTPPSPPTLSEVSALRDNAQRDPSPLGLRDRPMVGVMAVDAGARLGEVIALQNRDLRGSTLSIRRKGGWTQHVQLHEETQVMLHAWLKWRGGRPSDSMFTTLRRSADTWERTGPLTPAGLAGMLRRRSRAARLHRIIRPHDLRRFFISALLEGRAEPHEVMLAAGHKSLATTSRYIGQIREGNSPPGATVAALLSGVAQ
jgi:integrase